MDRYIDPAPDDYIYKRGSVIVKKMVDKQTGLQVCFKQYDDDDFHFIGEDEAKIYSKLPPHPNIIKCIDHFQTFYSYVLVLELGNMSLLDKLSNYIINPKHKHHLIKGCIEAVAFCHEHGIVHNDIDSTNFMCFNFGDVKLSDFGHSYDIVSLNIMMNRGKFGDKQINSDLINKLVYERNEKNILCKETWMPPECVVNYYYNNGGKRDIWRLGMVIYNILVERPLFCVETLDEMHLKYFGTNKFESGRELPNMVAPFVYDIKPRPLQPLMELLEDMLKLRPERRPTAHKVKERFSKIDVDMFVAATPMLHAGFNNL